MPFNVVCVVFILYLITLQVCASSKGKRVCTAMCVCVRTTASGINSSQRFISD